MASEENFNLFTTLYNKTSPEITKTKQNDVCQHNQHNINGNIVCTICGKTFDTIQYDQQEWRYYGSSDTRHSSDPNRCIMRKVDTRGIIKDVSDMGFSDRIIHDANVLYELVTKNRIYRGNTRKSIIFACIFHSYKLNDNPQTCEALMRIFSLDKKIALRGLKYVNLNAPKESNIRKTYITPEHIINDILDKFDANPSDRENIINIYESIKNRSSILNRSRPQSVAAGLIRYYCVNNNKMIKMDDFKRVVNLSELTINRIMDEISRILN